MTASHCPTCQSTIETGAAECQTCGTDLVTEDVTVADPAARHSGGSSVDPLDRTAKQLERALSPRIQLLRRLAGGGMSVVYLGREPGLRRLVAIKVLNEELAGDDVARARFTREAEAAAAIVNPHVIDIYQVGSLPRSGKPYIVMQFVEGMTLQQEILTGKPVAEPVAKAIIGEIASALTAAHAQGLVHRDIKPANVVLGRDSGRAVVLDFGIAAAMDRGTFSDSETLTRQGVALGTPPYMSPEQASAREVTGKSDVYSLGIVAFELLTGKRPFNETAPEAYIAAHLTDTPPEIRSLRPDLDKQFASLIDSCLAKDPDERPSADEIARAYIPSARMPIEWPPPGLETLCGLGWKQLRTLLGTASVGLAFFALLFFAPGSEALQRLTRGGVALPAGSESVFTGGGAQVVWLFLLAAAILGTVPLTAIARLRGWRIVAMLKWARRMGYPWPVLIDVALAGPDTGRLINGYGVFALTSDENRKRLLKLKRMSAAALLAAIGLTVIAPAVWLFAAGARLSAGTNLVTGADAALIFLPPVIAASVSLALSLPEWWIRNRAHHWKRSLGLSLPAMRTELVSAWLAGVGREPAPPGGRFGRWLSALVPVAAGGMLSMGILLITSVTLTAIITSSQWNLVNQPVATAVLGDSSRAAAWQYLGQRAWAVTLPTVATRAGDDTTAWLSGLSVSQLTDARSGFTTGAIVANPLRSLWRTLPAPLPDEQRAALERDTAGTVLANWRRIAHAGPSYRWWADDAAFTSAASPFALEFLSFEEIRAAAHANESAALLALDAGDQSVAFNRAAENIAAGLRLMADPVNGWMAPAAIQTGATALEEISVIARDREVQRQADELLHAVIDAQRVTTTDVRFGAAVMTDPVSPAGAALIGDELEPPWIRWWAIAGVAPGYCGNAREVLFGVDPGRHGLLETARDQAGDIPGTDGWIDLNLRWLGGWVEGTHEVEMSVTLGALRWIGLGKVARRIAFCRGEGSGVGGM